MADPPHRLEYAQLKSARHSFPPAIRITVGVVGAFFTLLAAVFLIPTLPDTFELRLCSHFAAEVFLIGTAYLSWKLFHRRRDQNP
jgi:hypothetical protein